MDEVIGELQRNFQKPKGTKKVPEKYKSNVSADTPSLPNYAVSIFKKRQISDTLSSCSSRKSCSSASSSGYQSDSSAGLETSFEDWEEDQGVKSKVAQVIKRLDVLRSSRPERQSRLVIPSKRYKRFNSIPALPITSESPPQNEAGDQEQTTDFEHEEDCTCSSFDWIDWSNLINEDSQTLDSLKVNSISVSIPDCSSSYAGYDSDVTVTCDLHNNRSASPNSAVQSPRDVLLRAPNSSESSNKRSARPNTTVPSPRDARRTPSWSDSCNDSSVSPKSVPKDLVKTPKTSYSWNKRLVQSPRSVVLRTPKFCPNSVQVPRDDVFKTHQTSESGNKRSVSPKAAVQSQRDVLRTRKPTESWNKHPGRSRFVAKSPKDVPKSPKSGDSLNDRSASPNSTVQSPRDVMRTSESRDLGTNRSCPNTPVQSPKDGKPNDFWKERSGSQTCAVQSPDNVVLETPKISETGNKHSVDPNPTAQSPCDGIRTFMPSDSWIKRSVSPNTAIQSQRDVLRKPTTGDSSNRRSASPNSAIQSPREVVFRNPKSKDSNCSDSPTFAVQSQSDATLRTSNAGNGASVSPNRAVQSSRHVFHRRSCSPNSSVSSRKAAFEACVQYSERYSSKEDISDAFEKLCLFPDENTDSEDQTDSLQSSERVTEEPNTHLANVCDEIAVRVISPLESNLSPRKSELLTGNSERLIEESKKQLVNAHDEIAVRVFSPLESNRAQRNLPRGNPKAADKRQHPKSQQRLGSRINNENIVKVDTRFDSNTQQNLQNLISNEEMTRDDIRPFLKVSMAHRWLGRGYQEQPVELTAYRGHMVWIHPKGTLDVIIRYEDTRGPFCCLLDPQTTGMKVSFLDEHGQLESVLDGKESPKDSNNSRRVISNIMLPEGNHFRFNSHNGSVRIHLDPLVESKWDFFKLNYILT